MRTQSDAAGQDVLDFWFSDDVQPQWFTGGPDFDADVRARFHAVHTALTQGQHRDWQETVLGRLATLIVLDQFSRNIYRDQAKAYASDAQAIEIAWTALRHGDDLWLKANRPDAWRAFVYLPFMHSESLEDQRCCIDLFLTNGPQENVAFARRHHDIIRRFGRFPHRNTALGRATTVAEHEFLKQEGSGFA